MKSRDESGALESPQFDDERTLLSARRVVPLDKVTSQRRLKRRFAFGLWVVIAIGLTATGLIYLWPDHGTQAQRIVTASPASETSEINKTSADSQEGSDIDKISIDAQSVDLSTGMNSVPKHRSSARATLRSSLSTTGILNNSVPTASAVASTVAENDDQYPNNRPRRRFGRDESAADQNQPFDNRARWEMGREIRRLERPRRDEVFKIRDIFEGRRRP